MKSQRRTAPNLAAPAPVAGPAPAGRRGHPGNAALADQLVAQTGRGPDLAMGRGQAAGMIAGFGMAAANALGSGGLPAMLNPNGYWDTMAEPARTELIRPGPAAHLKPAD